MSAEPWLCSTCAEEDVEAPGVRNLGTRGYCTSHLHELYATFEPSAFVDGGIGLQDGPMRPEYGPLEADLKCCRCGATWVGVMGDECWWCQREFENTREVQAKMLLEAPDVDPDDAALEARMEAWADRLIVGINAELVTFQQADLAWRRAVKRQDAA